MKKIYIVPFIKEHIITSERFICTGSKGPQVVDDGYASVHDDDDDEGDGLAKEDISDFEWNW